MQSSSSGAAGSRTSLPCAGLEPSLEAAVEVVPQHLIAVGTDVVPIKEDRNPAVQSLAGRAGTKNGERVPYAHVGVCRLERLHLSQHRGANREHGFPVDREAGLADWIFGQ